MPPMKKKTSHEVKVPPDRTKNQNGIEEKENKCSNLDLRNSKSPKTVNKLPFEEKKAEESNKLFTKPFTPKEKLKHLGFWSKKLQDLEENETKIKTCGLYEFNGTDESDNSFRIKKKRNVRIKKKRQPVVPQYKKPVEKGKKGKKLKQTHKQSLEEISDKNKECKKLSEKNEEFTFFPRVQTIGITSTPAINKSNLIDASNFLFLSPISKEEAEYSNRIMGCSPVGWKNVERSPLTIRFDKDRPRLETKLKRLSCRRVLRSGKTVDT